MSETLPGELTIREPKEEPEPWMVSIFELYIPKRTNYLSELYQFLHDAVTSGASIRLDGFSVYEVDGAYRGKAQAYEERVCVVRLVLPKAIAEARTPNPSVLEMGQKLLQITGFKEEEVWIVRYAGCEVFSFKNTGS